MKMSDEYDMAEPTSWQVPGTSSSLLVGPASTRTVIMGLSPPFHGFFESGGLRWSDLGRRLRAAVRAGGVVLSLTTASAWRMDLTDLVITAIDRRFGPLSQSRRHEIELCLSESLTNAMVHGNLGLESHPRDSLSGLLAFLERLETRLSDPALAIRRIDLMVTPTEAGGLRLAVQDRGQGFDAARFLARSVVTENKHGRGLPLIRLLADQVFARDAGRTLVMRFS